MLTWLMLLLAVGSGWTDHRSFENGRDGAVAVGPTGLGKRGAFPATTFSAKRAYSGRQSARATIERGSRGLGKWGGVLTFPEPLHENETLWMLLHVYLPDDFDWRAEGRGWRLVQVVTLSASREVEGAIDISIDPQTRRLNVDNSVTGASFSSTDPGRRCGIPVPLGKWQAVEVQVRWAAQHGRGVVRVWQDERMVYEETSRATLKTPFSHVRFAYLLGKWPGGAPRSQSIWLDDVVATNQTPDQRDRRGNPRLWPREGKGR